MVSRRRFDSGKSSADLWPADFDRCRFKKDCGTEPEPYRSELAKDCTSNPRYEGQKETSRRDSSDDSEDGDSDSDGLSSFSAKFANLGIENIDDMAYTTAEKADHTDLVEPDPSPYTYKGEVWDGLWQVERTFVHCPLPQSLSESSRMAYSEPWGGDADARPTKICRLSPKQS